MRRGVVQCLQNDKRRAFRAILRRAERPDRQDPCRRCASHQPRVRHDRARDAGAVDMRAFLAAERVEAARNRVREFRMLEIDSGIDHGDRDVGAMGQRMGQRQSKFRERILGGITFGQFSLLLLQKIAQVSAAPNES